MKKRTGRIVRIRRHNVAAMFHCNACQETLSDTEAVQVNAPAGGGLMRIPTCKKCWSALTTEQQIRLGLDHEKHARQAMSLDHLDELASAFARMAPPGYIPPFSNS